MGRARSLRGGKMVRRGPLDCKLEFAPIALLFLMPQGGVAYPKLGARVD